MEIELRKLCAENESEAIGFVIQGMNFTRYAKSSWLVDLLFGRYFFYAAQVECTQPLAAYTAEGKLAGFLLVSLRGEPRLKTPWWKRAYVRCVQGLRYLYFQGSDRQYDKANAQMLAAYGKIAEVEICLMAVNPRLQGKGIGNRLMHELERLGRGRHVCVYTDDDCEYSFYEHHGFRCVGRRHIEMRSGSRRFPLLCMLYAKQIPGVERAAGIESSTHPR